MNSNLLQELGRGVRPVFAASQRFSLDSKFHQKETQAQESGHEYMLFTMTVYQTVSLAYEDAS